MISSNFPPALGGRGCLMQAILESGESRAAIKVVEFEGIEAVLVAWLLQWQVYGLINPHTSDEKEMGKSTQNSY